MASSSATSALSSTLSSAASTIMSSTVSESASPTSSSAMTSPTNLSDALNLGGKAQQSSGKTAGQFIASIAVAIPIFAIQIAIFLLLKNKLRRVFSPRTYLVPAIERFAPPPVGYLNWLKPVFKIKDKEFIQKSGLDAYFFVRYLFVLLKIFVPLTLIIVPIISTLNKVNGRGPRYALEFPPDTQDALNVTGLDQLSFSNIRPNHHNRLWAHCILAVGVIVYCCYMFYEELAFFVSVRQDFLTTPQHRIRASATTVLVRTIPAELLTEGTLIEMFSIFPGGVKNVWINRNYDDLSDKTKLRLQLSRELELSEMNLIVNCDKVYQKRLTKKSELANGGTEASNTPKSDQRPESGESGTGKGKDPLWKEFVAQKDRDTMRLPMFGWLWVWSLPSFMRFGKSVDTIDFCRSEVAKLNDEIAKDQADPDKYPLMNSAFIQFNSQAAAHMACQAVSHKLPKQMTPRILELDPNDVIWDNMSIKWWEGYLRTAAVFIIVCAMIVGWAIPTVFITLVSNLNYLQGISWLSWIGGMPSWLRSAIQGILSPAALAGLLALLPVLLRLLSRLQGVETGMGIELTVQNYYFGFLFIQLFLLVSITSGLSSLVRLIAANVTNVPEVLASNLPKASSFFLSYIVLQGFSVSAAALLQIGPLLGLFVIGKLFDTTARQKWYRETNLPQIQWGTFFPVYTNLACIGLIYSVIAPLMLILLCFTFALFWVASRYNTIFVYRFRTDTGGLVYPRAINQLFTGLYVMELCLIGLFFLTRDDKDNLVCIPQGAIMIAMLILTIIYQVLLNRAFESLIKFLPIQMHLEGRFGRADEVAQPLTTNSPFPIFEDEHQDSKDLEASHPQPPTKETHELQPLPASSTQEQSSTHPAFRPSALTTLAKDITSTATRTAAKPLTLARDAALQQSARDHAAQRRSVHRGHALFHGLADELEDLDPEERDALVRRAFRHEALRARRPVAWIPRDVAGVADDEIRIAQAVGGVWVSNEYVELKAGGKVVYTRSPPDFDELDIIRL